MANRSSIAISSSRFAVLKIDDDFGDNDSKKKQVVQQEPQQNQNISSGKKKNKKKKEQNQKEIEKLKNLAFGAKSSSGGGGGGRGKQSGKCVGASGDGEDWNQWRAYDTAAVEEQFKDDLAQALLQSKLENERKKQEDQKLKERIAAGIEEPTTREGRKKKKQREKPQPMSLEQFKQLPPEKTAGSDDSGDEEPVKTKSNVIHSRVPVPEQDPSFFNSIDDDAAQILRQEKMQERYRKQYATESVISAKLKNSLEEKDQQIAELKSELEKLESEFKQVKKRNKQLCVILAQGEMKDKAQVLLQVDELTAVKDELTEQVTSLTAELEKEKSKNHGLKAENDKLKASKHGK